MDILAPGQLNQLIKQVQQQGVNIDVNQVVSLIKKYKNLKKEDFAPPVLEQEIYDKLLDLFRDPREKQAWDELNDAPQNTQEELKALLSKIDDYISRYQMAEDSHVDQAVELRDKVETKLEKLKEEERRKKDMEREREEWDKLDVNSYSNLSRYLQRYPDSVHRDEIDDMMWKIIISSGSVKIDRIQRYLDDMPKGKYVAEANQAIDSYEEWQEVKRRGSIIELKHYIDSHSNSLFIREARNRYYELQEEELKNMQETLSDYDVSMLQKLFEAGIFDLEELMGKGLITERSWDMLTNIDRAMLPKINMEEDPNVSAEEGCTDIFLFGTPSTGKTCLLMGLAGANGRGYSLNLTGKGGQYISDLTIYADHGITPSRTYGKFVTVINGYINDEDKNGTVVRHPVNLVEMSGEELAKRIAQNPDNEVSFENMGTGATKLLMNGNRKVFFVIVDPTKEMVPFYEEVYEVDEDGTKYVVDTKKTYISQKIILAKLASLFTSSLNAKIMEKVDAIHFIVTKADTLGELQGGRNEEAFKCLHGNYSAAISIMRDFVRNTKRINRSTDHKIWAYTFSLGKFYLGDVFELDSTDTLSLIETIKSVTRGNRELTMWDRIRNILN